MCKSRETAGGSTSGCLVVVNKRRGGIFTRLFFTPVLPDYQQQKQQKRLLHPGKRMDLSKLILSFLILFNVHLSERGVEVRNNVVSGTIISISTSKGSVILQKEGETTNVLSSSVNVPVQNPNTNRRWNHYETALSNTFPLALPDGANSSSTTAATTEASPSTTDLPVTMSSMELEEAAATNGTRKPSSGGRSSSNKTYHNNFNSNSNNLLNNARKYIASYEDLQSRFPDGSPFENNTSINMTVPLGDTAFLRCRVRNLGERSISWIRRRDWHILTTGKTTYTNDERFNVLHVDGTEDWTLQIKFVQKRDNGTYECQVSTGTGIISYFVNLFIAVPEAFILGNGEYHVEQGSNINLVCVIEKSPKPPEFIFWYHNERMINYGNSREVVVRTEPGARTHSRLTIRDARIADSGNYTCKTAHAEPASIFVYVSQASGLFSGDKMAAIQRRKNTGTSSVSSPADATAPVQSSTSSGGAASVALTAMTTFPTTTAVALSLAGVAASLTISSIQLSSITGDWWWGSSSVCIHYKGESPPASVTTATTTSSNMIISTVASTTRGILNKRNKMIISSAPHHHHRHHQRKSNIYCWYATATANFLLSLFLLIGATVGDVAVTTVQLLLSLLFLPILVFLAAGAQITYFILVTVGPLLLHVLPQAKTYRNRYHHHRSYNLSSSFSCHHCYSCYSHHDYCPSANYSVSFTLQNPKQESPQQKFMLHQEKEENVEQQQQRRQGQEGKQQWEDEQQRKYCCCHHLDDDHCRRWWLCSSCFPRRLQEQKRHFVIFVLPQLLRRLVVYQLYQKLFLSSSSSSSSWSSMDKSLPVFLSIAQSLWTPFSSGFSRFSRAMHDAAAGGVGMRAGGALLFFVKGIFTRGMSLFLLLLFGSSDEKKSQSQPLFPSHPSNRLGFRTISHLLIFPSREEDEGPILLLPLILLYPINHLLLLRFRRPSFYSSCLHLLA